jgi:hypothetical protein
MSKRRKGEMRSAILDYITGCGGEVALPELYAAMAQHFGEPVPPSSVRSSLNAGVNSGTYERTGSGQYRLARPS